MSSHTERVWEDTLQLGKANQVTVELARRHCLNMIFTECGGRGMAEEATGLPINMREVHCLVARGNQAMNLDLIASDFYKAYCVGCTHRRPTGGMPNLATVMEGRAAQAATAAEMERLVTEQRHREWARRVDGVERLSPVPIRRWWVRSMTWAFSIANLV